MFWEDVTYAVKSILEISDVFGQVGTEKRKKIAGYIQRIVNCLNDISTNFKNDEICFARIAELKELAKELPETIGEEIVKDRSNELSSLLIRAIGEDPEVIKHNEKAIQQIEETSGKLTALAYRIENFDLKASSNLFDWFTKRKLVYIALVFVVIVPVSFVLEPKVRLYYRIRDSQIYLHYYNENNEDDAKALEKILEDKGATAKVIYGSIKHPQAEPLDTEVRYYWEKDKITARFLKKLAQQQLPDTTIDGPTQITVEPGTHLGQVELWIEK